VPIDLAAMVLRRPVDEDAPDALLLCTDADVARWNPVSSVVDLDTALGWCRRAADGSDGAPYTWHAVDGGTGRLLAQCSVFDVEAEHLVGGIGYRVAPWARGGGVGRTVLDAVTRWAFAEPGLVRVELHHSVPNVASCRVATAAGYLLEGAPRSQYVDGDGLRQDCHIHGRLVTDPTPDLPHPVMLRPA
jgi:RimJ/RimL family protein N-acetyltransferase